MARQRLPARPIGSGHAQLWANHKESPKNYFLKKYYYLISAFQQKNFSKKAIFC